MIRAMCIIGRLFRTDVYTVLRCVHVCPLLSRSLRIVRAYQCAAPNESVQGVQCVYVCPPLILTLSIAIIWLPTADAQGTECMGHDPSDL